MKKLLYLLTLAASPACQPAAPATAEAPEARASTSTASAPPPAAPASAAPADTALPAATLALLRQHNLAPLWRGYQR